MRRIKTVAAVFTAAFALVAVSAASASAHEFVASKTGTTKDKSLTVQKFHTNGGTTECKEETSEGTVTELKSKTSVEKVKFAKCTAFGFGVTVSEGEDEFNAEGTVTLLKKQVVKAFGCEVVVEPTKNSNLKTVEYSNNGGKLKVKSTVKGITYHSTGGLCGSSGENGEFTGESEEELVGGTLEFV